MPDLTKDAAAREAAAKEMAKPKRAPKKRGRPKGSKNKVQRGPGRPKGVSLKGYVKVRDAKRIAKEAVAKFKAKLPGIIKREVKKLLK